MPCVSGGAEDRIEACKLDCGHVFNWPCIYEWLLKCPTCPVCRVEVEKRDASYLQGKSVSHLRVVCKVLGVSIEGCLYKSNMVERIVQSELKEIGAPVMREGGLAAGPAVTAAPVGWWQKIRQIFTSLREDLPRIVFLLLCTLSVLSGMRQTIGA
ncbi:hypothetical protein B484DRAFT_338535 [Ochromonadaceae sp. CCMP2298]|nr:hypothetical protein B484DRAFT_338535 [Ochromonadaceae sp. CCMP2298]